MIDTLKGDEREREGSEKRGENIKKGRGRSKFKSSGEREVGHAPASANLDIRQRL